MLFGGGRILVAAVGAVVLVVVAIYVVRSVGLPSPKSHQVTSVPTAQTGTSASDAANPSDGGMPSGQGGDGGDGSSSGDGSGGSGGSTDGSSTDESTTDESKTEEPFTATTEKVSGFLGTVLADVELPQVTGGNPDVAEVFNDEMKSALNTQADSITGGKLEGRPGSGVRIGERVLSGVLRTSAVDVTKATPRALVSTVVIDAESGSVITLSSLFNDLTEGLQQLAKEAKTLGPSSSAAESFDTTKVQPTEEMFTHWSAETDGMRVFFEQGTVAPNAAGIVEVTVPWDNLTDVMKSGVAQIVSS